MMIGKPLPEEVQLSAAWMDTGHDWTAGELCIAQSVQSVHIVQRVQLMDTGQPESLGSSRAATSSATRAQCAACV